MNSIICHLTFLLLINRPRVLKNNHQCNHCQLVLHQIKGYILTFLELTKTITFYVTDAFTKYAEVVAILNKKLKQLQQNFSKMDLQIQRNSLNSHRWGKRISQQIIKRTLPKIGHLTLKKDPYHLQCNVQVEVSTKLFQNI